MKQKIVWAALASLAIGGVATAAISGESVSDRRAKALAAYTPVGKAKDCVTISQIRSTRVIDNKTIDVDEGRRKGLSQHLALQRPQPGRRAACCLSHQHQPIVQR